MAITRVWIEEGCIMCCSSQENCPEVFEVRPDIHTAVVKTGVDFSQHENGIKRAANRCPVSVIKYEEVKPA